LFTGQHKELDVNLGKSFEEESITTMRTGVTPSGRQLDPEFMPWKEFGQLGEEELRGIWLYLSSLPQP
jgi:hypothetical protein